MMQPIHILIVDDEPDVESLLSQHFRREIRKGEYVLNFAGNGREALSLIEEISVKDIADVDIVLTDLNMPVMDGLTLLSKLNELVRSPKTVVVSAYSDMENIRGAMNAGAFDFITKPIQRKDLDLTVKKAISTIEQEREIKAQLEAAKVKLVQSEKMSALGQMVAGLAHEINNPVNFIYGNLRHAQSYIQDLQKIIEVYKQEYPQPTEKVQDVLEDIDIDFLTQDTNNLFNSLNTGAVRIRELVLSLRNFSRLDESAQKAVNIHDGIDSTLLILGSRLQSNKHTSQTIIEKSYGDLPLVECYPSQLNQVIMNLLANAIDALEAHWSSQQPEEAQCHIGRIQILTEAISEDWVRIVIEDNGAGIEESAIAKLFDPFFTTKPIGKGTGLGLSISYQIVVEKHQGKLYCQSSPGEGTRFCIELPTTIDKSSAEQQGLLAANHQLSREPVI